MEEMLPKYGFALEKLTPSSSYILEIGFGDGTHLAGMAMAYPDIGYIGCEPYLNGVASLLGMIKAQAIENIMIYQDDAIDLLNSLPNYCLSQIYILFPDPWRKTKHHKRRIINTQNLILFAQKLAPKAQLVIATDHEEYASWIFEHLADSDLFALKPNLADYQFEPTGWIKTKYQKKAEDQGLKIYFFVIKKLT